MKAPGEAPVLSIVVISRNEEAFIGRCLDAVLGATASIAGREVVLVDSASEDRTVEIARRFPVRIVRLAPCVRPTPAMGRHVGFLLTSGAYVHFVDGDTTLDGGWVETALAALAGRPRAAGVAGREDQLYYRSGSVVAVRPDYFGTGDREHDVDQLGGNGLYRRAALATVGSFNPFVRSFEEAELGARLRRGGWVLFRVPALMAQHHTQPPDAVREYWRRLRSHLLTGQGQVLRLALRQGLFWEHARRLNRPLLFGLWLLLGVAAFAYAAVAARPAAPLAWVAVGTVLLVVLAVRGRSLTKPFRLLLDWAVSLPPLVYGFSLPPRDTRDFDLAAAVAEDRGPAACATDAGERRATVGD